MKRMRWYDYITYNIYWLGLNIATGSITPIILPFLVAQFVPAEVKATYLGRLRVVGLAVAMMIQPMAGLFSDRSTLRWGRRRPYIVLGTLLDVVFLAIVGMATSYWMLLLGIVLLQFSSNIAHGALQGLIPDLVPQDQRGRASGVKAIMELLPVFLVMGVGPLVDRGYLWAAIGFVMGSLLLTMLITALTVHEKPLREKPSAPLAMPLLQIVALTLIFVAVSQGSERLVAFVGRMVGSKTVTQLIVVGLAGLAAMAGSIIIGVYLGARVGLGKDAQRHPAFVWWVVNRLLFLAAIGSIQGFAQYFLSDRLRIENAATVASILLGVVALFLLPSALISGWLSDRLGRFRLVLTAGLVAAAGTLLLLLSSNILMVLVSGCIIGVGTGTFMATNWALGTDLVPPEEAGRYLGISNLAGAGAGIVGAGIGGPMADFFNAYQQGLGYLVIFAIYGALFLLSSLILLKVRTEREPETPKG